MAIRRNPLQIFSIFCLIGNNFTFLGGDHPGPDGFLLSREDSIPTGLDPEFKRKVEDLLRNDHEDELDLLPEILQTKNDEFEKTRYVEKYGSKIGFGSLIFNRYFYEIFIRMPSNFKVKSCLQIYERYLLHQNFLFLLYVTPKMLFFQTNFYTKF